MKLERFQIEYVRNCWQVWLEGNKIPDYIRVKYLNPDDDKNKDYYYPQFNYRKEKLIAINQYLYFLKEQAQNIEAVIKFVEGYLKKNFPEEFENKNEV